MPRARRRAATGLLAAAAAWAVLASAARDLVAGSYYALWDLTWYHIALPGPLAVILFLALPAAPLGRIRWLPWLLAAGYALAGALTSSARLLGVAGALGLSGALWLAAPAAREMPESVALGLALDTGARLAAAGAAVWGHPVVGPLYGVILALLLAMGALRGPAPSPPPAGAYAGLAVVELGAAYPNAVLHLAGLRWYTPGVYALAGLALLAAALLGAYLPRRAAAALALLGLAGVLAGFRLGAWAPLLLAALPAAASSRRGASLGGRLAWGTVFVAIMLLGVSVYAGVYLGLPWMQGRLWIPAGLAAAWLLLSLLPPRGGRPRGPRWALPGRAALALLGVALIWLAGYAGLLAQEARPAPAAGGRVVHVVQYNIHQGYTYDGHYNAYLVARYLAAQGPVVACMEEVDTGRLTSAYQDQLLALWVYAGMEAWYQPAIAGTYGVAVAAPRGSLEGVGGLLLPSTGEQRAAAKARAMGLVAVAVHLGLSPGERERQARVLAAWALREPAAQVLCGDLNEQRGRALGVLQELYVLRPHAGTATCCLGPEGLNQTIDYVGVLRGSGLRIEECWVDAGARYSDHLPVHALIRLPPAP